MHSRLSLLLFLLALSLTGCDRLRAVYTPQTERINAAFPVREELEVARHRLLAEVDDPSAAKKRLVDTLAQKMQVRALTCSTGVDIGRFDTAAQIRGKLTNVACFREQDEAIEAWVGMQRFIVLLGKPPQLPLAELPPRTTILSPPEEPTSEVFLARAANMAVAKGTKGTLSTVELPSGKLRVASYGQAVRAGPGTTLSPNGRILASQGYNALTVLDTETGSAIWTPDNYRQVVAWIPEVGATILAKAGSSAPMLLDHARGTFEAYPVPFGSVSWAVNVPQKPTRVVIGNATALAVVDHARAADGSLSVQVVQQLRLAGRGHTSGTPQLMAGGKRLVYVSMNDLGWVDLEIGQQGAWPFSALGAYGFSKLSEQTLVMDIRGAGVRADAYVFDIEQGTLQPVEGSTNDGLLQPLVTRSGFARRGHSRTWLGTTVRELGEPRPLASMMVDRVVAQQLARAPAAENAQGTSVMPRGWPAENAAPPVLERPVRPMLAGLPSDARVAAIGVYEAAVTTRRSDGGRVGAIRVSVGPGTSPLVLVLSSYEPVNWHIEDNGRKIAAILLSSYAGDSHVLVNGKPDIVRAKLGYAYQFGSAEYQRLQTTVAQYVAAPIASFQGGYKGQEFSVR